ncbi:MAG: hypothetical protein US96_C0024G0004 [Candidatus Woesebacteria bacterium GW2011_GWB1_38_5b]|uniref:Uncharacterized protein n=1 Tax=Candidatus Woesebacteria bacterium GW2011_GWB1_38_5b TaxID=1618569 RepID=A0A0G0K7L3_9BACT|nr:MAG: hypothetical protein US96_C0024G0004 [Candidatus Woesebacteria bacterium GW2011_GWB1_38_5b]OGH47674.1 MAG: hypothetical protein A3A51_03620 [Candidatus Levybacteria bacterium RIFCSPLOWO2_01_FULL_39_10]
MVEQEMPPRLEDPEVDRIWNDFVSVERERSDDFEALLKDPQVRPEFQERAIDVLLTPRFDHLPFKVNAHHVSSEYDSFLLLGYGRNKYEFTSEQASYAAKRIPQFMEQAWRIYRRKNEGDKGQGDRNSEAKNAISALRSLNTTIPRLIPLISREEAEELLESFNPYDIGIGPGSSTHLGPIHMVFNNDQIDDSLKIRARQRAIAEGNRLFREITQSGRSPDFLSGALISVIDLRTEGDDSEALPQELTDEINFMLESNTEYQLMLDTESAYEDLEDMDTRHKLIRHQVFGEEPYPWGDTFSEYSDEDTAFFRQVIRDFPEDTELTIELQERINAYEEWAKKTRRINEERDTQWQHELQREQQALSEMKKPSAGVPQETVPQ